MEAYQLYSRVFWIFLSNVIKIDPYNFKLYCFKVGAFFVTAGRALTEREKVSAQIISNWFANKRKELKKLAREGLHFCL